MSTSESKGIASDEKADRAPRKISDGSNPTAHSTSDETTSHEGHENSPLDIIDEHYEALLKVLRLTSNMYNMLTLDAFVGLYGQASVQSFHCIAHEESLFVWLGDIDISMFSKSAVLNLATLAENNSCKRLVMLLNRKHD